MYNLQPTRLSTVQQLCIMAYQALVNVLILQPGRGHKSKFFNAQPQFDLVDYGGF